jgi:F-type H+-transporting ATPase subunit delta
MSDIRAGYRYATAILGVAVETNSLDAVHRDFQSMEKVIAGSPEFRAFLKSPVINAEKKKKVLSEIFGRIVSELTSKFILLLASKGRENLLPEIVRQFYRLRDERLGILNVTARSAVPLSKAQEEDLTGRIEKATKKKIRLSTFIDPDLKGGFMVQHDDTVWDASVRHQLDVLRDRLTQGSA